MSLFRICAPSIHLSQIARMVWSLLFAIMLTGLGVSKVQSQNLPQNFNAVPLVDFTSTTPLYKGLNGNLYDLAGGTNSIPAGSQHDVDGQVALSNICPRNAQTGACDPNGKIIVLGIGMSNWTDELCHEQGATSPIPVPQVSKCDQHTSFLYKAANNVGVNHRTMVLVDCALGGYAAVDWTSDTPPDGKAGAYSICENKILCPNTGSCPLSTKQIQVILYKDADARPSVPLPATPQACPTVPTNQDPDECLLLFYFGQTARFVKQRYPNVAQMFMHSRIYGGYAPSGTLNPEPFAYESGFASKSLIMAQIRQVGGQSPDPTTGDLSYKVAPWLAWGPYFWASGITPCANCEVPNTTWKQASNCNTGECDFNDDLTHPRFPCGRDEVSQMMLHYYCTSKYTSWFRNGQACTFPPPVSGCSK